MSMSLLCERLRQGFIEFNIFASGSTDRKIVRIERWSSRTYLVLLSIILIVLTLYTAFTTQTTTVEVKNPSYTTFQLLQEKYPNTLRCPCSNTGVKFSTFAQMYARFHQVCSSVFISQEWIEATFESLSSSFWPMDARTVSASFAEGLRYMCQMSEAAVDSKIIIFLSDALYTPNADPNAAEANVIRLIKTIPETAVSQVFSTLNSFSYAVSGESAISALGTNTVAYAIPQTQINIWILPNTYRMVDGSLCYCLPTQKCSAPAGIYFDPASPLPGVLNIDMNRTLVKGMKTDCYPYDALTESTLECFYDLECIKLLVSNASKFTPLNASIPSKFALDQSIQSLIWQLMVEEYGSNYSAVKYYTECGPLRCIYTYTHYSTFLTVITTIIGLIGGLNTLLQIVVPKLVQNFIRFQQFIRPSSSDEVVVNVNAPIPG